MVSAYNMKLLIPPGNFEDDRIYRLPTHQTKAFVNQVIRRGIASKGFGKFTGHDGQSYMFTIYPYWGLANESVIIKYVMSDPTCNFAYHRKSSIVVLLTRLLVLFVIPSIMMIFFFYKLRS
jgi:hypothetical protein